MTFQVALVRRLNEVPAIAIAIFEDHDFAIGFAARLLSEHYASLNHSCISIVKRICLQEEPDATAHLPSNQSDLLGPGCFSQNDTRLRVTAG